MQIYWQKTIFSILPSHIIVLLQKLSPNLLNQLTEIRIRVNQPLVLIFRNSDYVVKENNEKIYLCQISDVERVLQLITKNSLYTLEQELKGGFITIPGGHRVGLAGQAIVAGGKVKTLRNFSSVNIRIAREVQGCADGIVPYLISSPRRIHNSLIISPPRCGKTTILRDLSRQLSTGIPSLNFDGVQIGIVDERSEIGACSHGIPTVNIGQRTDILDGCPKAEGMLMLIRSMSPQLIITDEIGRHEDVIAIQEALNAGVNVIATVHAATVEELLFRPFVQDLIEYKFFDRYVLLQDYPGPGTVAKVIEAKTSRLLFCLKTGVRVCG